MSIKEVRKKLFGQILLEKRLVNEKQIESALEMQQMNGKSLGKTLVESGATTHSLILEALSDYLNMDIIDLKKVELEPDIIEKIPPSVAQLYRVLPIAYDGNTLTLAQEEPLNIEQMDDLRFLLKYDLKAVLVEQELISDCMDKYYPGQHESIEALMDTFENYTPEEENRNTTESSEIGNLENLVDNAPVKSFVNLILLQAISDKASDIHFETFENEFHVRFRVDGMLLDEIPVPPQFANGIVSRLKVMGNMDIAEKRVPQDGHAHVTIRGHHVDIRISTLPTKHGESIVLRILDKNSVSLDLTELGLNYQDLNTIKHLMKKTYGIILVTGPTGSGKTTTLYASLNFVRSSGKKIITTEDPVEYDIDGITQIQIHSEIGVTFANSLRAILRQDPDIILMGEIRDLETVEVAMHASLTGHLVLSTLHTNDAPSTITRLINMGVKPYLITASLTAAINQRLVRKLCPECREEYVPDKNIINKLRIPESVLGEKHFYRERGCSKCNNTGYKGRLSILEIMTINDEICSHIIQQSSTETIREVARRNGMRTLLESGLNAIYNGQTTIKEVMREVA
ncbi:MAG: type II/IV secretion system protein [Candidatus Scalindua sp. AMX11]|nr:MAG: type II/IV secretion system protein [Candidatus Scalindua sp.]NOG82427.1 Flp pilus assembly complex ATPase component TadA [Planctomycetota bacterium]RZV70218.1 MAG: type II/IV secretion system protein [Candidatus Scalindua sp. SCAELEC01]TDE64071.1 MAG: type II/IV secretion system protein [Candidatus Scalindua sp. AMX11]GJQ60104.1 MAG: type IV fimbrial assembly protein PilB [Candidatus Scalindua sp.]